MHCPQIHANPFLIFLTNYRFVLARNCINGKTADFLYSVENRKQCYDYCYKQPASCSTFLDIILNFTSGKQKNLEILMEMSPNGQGFMLVVVLQSRLH